MNASKSQMLERITAWSTFGTAVVAAVALVFAWVQLRSAATSQREATAQQTYGEYLKLAIEKPNLAEGLPEMPKEKQKRAEYSWFVSYFLHASEHILLVRPDDVEWKKAIASQICLHKVFFRDSEWKTLKEHYNKGLCTLIDDTLGICE